MTKSEIINALAQRCGVTQAAARLFHEALNECVIEGLKSDQVVKIKGLGTFKTVSVKARKSVSINGGEEIEIPAHDKITFTPEREFAEMVNGPLAHLEVVDLGESSAEDDSPAEDVPSDDYKMSARMKKLGEEAEALKGLLDEINGTKAGEKELLPLQGENNEPVTKGVALGYEQAALSGRNNDDEMREALEQQISEEADGQPLVETEHAPSSDDTIEQQAPDIDEPVVEETRHATSQQSDGGENYQTEHAPSLPDDGEEEKTGRKMTHGGMLGRVFLCVLLLLLVGFGAFYWVKFSDNDVDTEKEKPVVVQEKKAEPQNVTVEPVIEKESQGEQLVSQTNEEPPTVKPAAEKQSSGKPTVDQLRKIKVDYAQTKGTETVRDGSRLTMISLRAYGDKRFWIYIYLANRDQLNTPGEIQTGMIIKIPKLDSRLTDASNPECLKLAKELEEKYVK